MDFLWKIIPNWLISIIKYILYVCIYKSIWNFSTIKNMPIWDIFKKNFHLWENVDLGSNNYFMWEIYIWDYSYINSPNTKINAWKNSKIIIWKYCSISWNVSIIAKNEHNLKFISTNPRLYKERLDYWKDIIIWNDVWIGANVIILPWVKIWDGAVIWAWSIVTKDIPEYTVYWWNPAKFIKNRFTDDELKKVKKYNLVEKSIEDIKNNCNI